MKKFRSGLATALAVLLGVPLAHKAFGQWDLFQQLLSPAETNGTDNIDGVVNSLVNLSAGFFN
jgi:hypothetical protein